MRIKLIVLSVLLSSCSYVSTPVLSPYKMDIRQGNYVTPEMRSKLKLGMSKQQAHYVLGTPLVNDVFHANRWDYVYRLDHDGKLADNERMTLYFEDDKLVRIDDSHMPPLPPQPAPAVAAAPAAAAVAQPVAAPEPVVAEPLAAAPAPQPAPPPDPAKEILKALQAWAEAWSSRNIDGYLAAYSPDFKPANMSREAWEKQRRSRIGKAQEIGLGLGDFTIRLHDPSHATVTFTQNYRSASYRDDVRKTLELEKVGDAWLITSEQAEKE